MDPGNIAIKVIDVINDTHLVVVVYKDGTASINSPHSPQWIATALREMAAAMDAADD